jgi:lipopolysaccharide export system permease protein
MIIYRTILKDLFKNFAVIIFSLSVLLFMEKFVRLTRLFMGKGADFSDVIKIYIYLQPSILLLSIPMAILITIFLTYGRMASDSETVVLKSSGMSFPRISRPAVTLSVLCCLILFFISLYVLPRSMSSLRHTIQEAIVKKASMTFEEETFSDVFKSTVIYIKKIHSKNKFTGIFVYRDADKPVEEPLVIFAEKGVISSNPEEGLIKLRMDNGLIHSFKDNTSSEITFNKYDFVLNAGIEYVSKTKPEEIRTSDLWRGRASNVLWGIEINRRIALPLACIIFGILGPALSTSMGKTGRLGGFSLSLVILILYYVLMILAEGLAESGKISSLLGGWTANIFFGMVSLVFYYIACKDKPIKRF